MGRGRSRWPPPPDQEVFTTGEVARICNVTIRTVIRWIDSGRLKGYRIPGSRDRRVTRRELVRFLRRHDLPLGPLDPRAGLKRILVVDDEPEVLELIRPTLESLAGVEVHTATNGYEAGTKTVALRPDLLLIDYNLGDVTGVDVARTVRTDPDLAGIKIVCMSGFLTPDEVAGVLEQGIDGFVAKPFDLEDLKRRAAGILEIDEEAA